MDRIRERFGNRAANRLKTDVVGTPSEHQTEYGNRYYESLAAWLNQNKIRLDSS
ncbi:MAG TPA: hypothetical protein VFS12_15495 [Terriglobia bacterium]|nr:hypothetical protein [Terriglobia bacterium]